MATVQNVPFQPTPLAGPTPAPWSSAGTAASPGGYQPDRVERQSSNESSILTNVARTGLDVVEKGADALEDGLKNAAGAIAKGATGAAAEAAEHGATTGALAKAVSGVAKVAGPLGFMMDGAEIANGYHADGDTVGPHAIAATAGAVGSYLGGLAGAAAGSAAGPAGAFAGSVAVGFAVGTGAEAAAKHVLGVKP